MNAYARELDFALLDIVADWSRGGIGCTESLFNEQAISTYLYQTLTNVPYARYAASLGFDSSNEPRNWREIPAVPSSAFKDSTLATFDIAGAELEFHTSGTTAALSGKHYVERAALYDATLAAGFDRFMLPDRAKLRYLNLVPNPRMRKHSSLGYMMGTVSVLRGDGKAAYFLDGDDVDVDGFIKAFDTACAQAQPACIAGTAFAFVALLDALATRGKTFLAPPGSRIMETGGFKGRTRVVEREELYAALSATLGVAYDAIVAEYGMTELLSQYYDSPESRGEVTRTKVAPPWLRPLVVDANGAEVPDGTIGFLRHVDLANRSSVIAIDTEDRGYRSGAGIVLLGRDETALPRGCSLDAEDLLAR